MFSKRNIISLSSIQLQKQLDEKLLQIENEIFKKEIRLTLEELTAILRELDLIDLSINSNKELERIAKSILKGNILKSKAYVMLLLAKLENKNNIFSEETDISVKDFISIKRKIPISKGKYVKMNWCINYNGSIKNRSAPQNLNFNYDGSRYIIKNFDSTKSKKASDIFKTIDEIAQLSKSDETGRDIEDLLCVKLDFDENRRIAEIFDGTAGTPFMEEYCYGSKGLQLNFEKVNNINTLTGIIDKVGKEKNELRVEYQPQLGFYRVRKGSWREKEIYKFKGGKLSSVNNMEPNCIHKIKVRLLEYLMKKRGIQLENNRPVFEDRL